MRVVIEGAPGELRLRAEELTEALGRVFAAEGMSLQDLAKALPSSSPSPSDLRPVCLREAVADRLRWYESVLLPAMHERIAEVLV